jgi:hypothetical protein
MLQKPQACLFFYVPNKAIIFRLPLILNVCVDMATPLVFFVKNLTFIEIVTSKIHFTNISKTISGQNMLAF